MPNKQVATSNTFTLIVYPASGLIKRLPTVVNKAYSIDGHAATETYEPVTWGLDDGKLPSSSCDAVTYTSEVFDDPGTDTSWITPTASGAGMQWSTADTSLIGNYNIRTTLTIESDAGIYVQTESVEWLLAVSLGVYDCAFAESLSIDPESSIFGSETPVMMQVEVQGDEQEIVVDDAEISRLTRVADCGGLAYGVRTVSVPDSLGDSDACDSLV